ncbi:MAG: hypothetical protein VX205_12245 [Pseudomonadota bacterium]|nr:hypothetical protein [Sphingobium sp.]MCC4252017.1 hypothetical protein [Sphingobium naphthae]MEC7931323.1 hypothetical protein [Pseudomonadota bacterium]MEC8035751.1 hypothetical protein [Pseudomonadota bacterium]|tara:strand:+ start:169 stop:417 length:249 start_codon:yes stop_codon:yes gene_type:complete
MPMPDKRPWFRSYIFSFWVIPVHWKGWLLLFSTLASTYALLCLMLDVFDEGSAGMYICATAYIIVAGTGLTLMHIHTEKHKG